MILALRNERIRKGWSLSFVANKVGTTKSTIQMLETGQRKPSYEVLVQLLNLFGDNDPHLLFAVVDNTKEPDKQAEKKKLTP